MAKSRKRSVRKASMRIDKAAIDQVGIGGVWGPAVDPAPDFGRIDVRYPRGWEPEAPGDPAPIYRLLDRAKIAEIRVRQLDFKVQQLENQLDLLKLERQMLKKEYGIR